MTDKLFYKDSHMSTFSAVVRSCENKGDYFEAVLDRTAFFPEGGGQRADTGILDGKEVFDVRESQGVIFHKMKAPLEIGSQVEGVIDWKERFSNMQQHSGEHIVSGLVHTLYGYDNVGFHMGKDAITMDFNGVLTKSQLREIEKMANEAVVKNLDIQVCYPSEEELRRLSYRSKIEIEGQVRIVVIPGYDACACCAPHVKKTGEIGVIKLVGMQNYKGGVRIFMLCGFRALEDYEKKSESVRAISTLLSAKENEISQEVLRLKDSLGEAKSEIALLKKQILTCKASDFEKGQNLAILFEEGLGAEDLREMANLILQKEVCVAAIFSGNPKEGYRYVIGSRKVDTRPFAKTLNETFQGRGGGKPEMVQGSFVTGNELEIRKVVEVCRNEI